MRKSVMNSRLVTVLLLAIITAVAPAVGLAATIIVGCKWCYDWGKESRDKGD